MKRILLTERVLDRGALWDRSGESVHAVRQTERERNGEMFYTYNQNIDRLFISVWRGGFIAHAMYSSLWISQSGLSFRCHVIRSYNILIVYIPSHFAMCASLCVCDILDICAIEHQKYINAYVHSFIFTIMFCYVYII